VAGRLATTEVCVNDVTERVVPLRTTVGAEPVGLKLDPEIVIVFGETE
jgi:hypothetical protein